MCQNEVEVAAFDRRKRFVTLKFVVDYATLPYRLSEQIVVAARSGQLLPRFSLAFILQLLLHLVAFNGGQSRTQSWERLQHISLFLMCFAGITNICGYVLLIVLYKHSVENIFNRKLPSTLIGCLPSFSVHLGLLKPLEIIFRYATARFRVLPDILVLGEVRCGTTTLCQYLSSIDGCKPPFCLWKHPELDHKETFYFVGHYLGRVDPFQYRMCFPLAIVKWFRQRVCGKPFFTFDGCAQYLTHPAVPQLIARAYRDAGQPPPVLVACVRNPVDQAVSWWRYENNAMLWGGEMGLSQWNTALRTRSYPPLSLSKALSFSSSSSVEHAYNQTENLFATEEKCSYVLPPWSLTWPMGQLSGIGRNGRYASNIKRYETVFSKFSITSEPIRRVEMVPAGSKLSYVNVVPLELLQNDPKLERTLASLMSQIIDRRSNKHPLLKSPDCFRNEIHRNASNNDVNADFLEPTKVELKQLGQFFSKESDDLATMTGFSLDW